MREWEHPPTSKGMGDCTKRDQPVYTDPAKPPKPCEGVLPTPWGPWPCDNEDWASKGIVHRIKEDGRVIHREGEKPNKPQGDGRDGRDKV